ncbi:hypothetical protein [Caudoviricetes sp.]|nr:hypothetical protein [Caudoviricetes sp.]
MTADEKREQRAWRKELPPMSGRKWVRVRRTLARIRRGYTEKGQAVVVPWFLKSVGLT